MNYPQSTQTGVRRLFLKPATHSLLKIISTRLGRLSVLPAGVLLLGSLTEAALGQQTATVNCSATLSESGGDDLARLRGYFDTATWPQRAGPLNRETRWRMDQIRANSVRSIHDEDGSILSSGTFVPSAAFKETMDRYKDMGMSTPHIVVGLKKPDHLPPFPDANPSPTPSPSPCPTPPPADGPWNWTAAEWDNYEDYCYKLIRHVMLDYRGGWQEVRFEITNEAEVAGELWSAVPNYTCPHKWGPGQRELYDGFLKIYREWAQAAQRVANETGKNPRIMGPVTGIGSVLYWTSTPWHIWFLDDITAEGLRLDVFTIHFYGPSDPIGNQPDYYPIEERRYPFAQLISDFRTKLNAVGRPNTPIHVTEWGPCDWFLRPTLMKAVNPTPVGGAWTAAMLREMLTRNIEDATLLYFREPEDESESGSEWHLIAPLATLHNVTYAKPSFNVLRMFSSLPGTRRPVTTTNWHNDLGVTASSSNTQVGIVVHNYNYNACTEQEKTTAQTVTLSVAGSSLNGSQIVRRYLVDANNSNMNKYLLLNQIPHMHDCELKLVETFNVTFGGGAASLPACTLDPSAVSLWLIGGPAIPEGDLVGDYTLTSVDSGNLLDIANLSLLAGANAIQYHETGAISQTWALTDIGNGYYKVINKNSGMALDVQNASTANAASILQYGYGGGANQIFAVRLADDGLSHKLVASHSGRIVDTGGGTSDGLPTIQYEYNGAANHRWFLRSSAEIRAEAESGTLGNGSVINLSANASNGRVIGSMHGPGAYVLFNNIANPNPSGLSKIEIVYASADAVPAQLSVYLNGAGTAAATLLCAKTADWDAVTGVVSFKAQLTSLNTIKIVGGNGGVNIDYIKLSPAK